MFNFVSAVGPFGLINSACLRRFVSRLFVCFCLFMFVSVRICSFLFVSVFVPVCV